jgi:hypothetical protein
MNKYSPELVASIKAADTAPPAETISNIDELFVPEAEEASMGRAFVLVNADVLSRLTKDPKLTDQIRIMGWPKDHGDGLYQVDVSSPLLPKDCVKQQCLILDPLGFSPDLDTGPVPLTYPFRTVGPTQT